MINKPNKSVFTKASYTSWQHSCYTLPQAPFLVYPYFRQLLPHFHMPSMVFHVYPNMGNPSLNRKRSGLPADIRQDCVLLSATDFLERPLAAPLLRMASAGERMVTYLNPQSRRRSSTVLEDRRKVTADHTPGRAP